MDFAEWLQGMTQRANPPMRPVDFQFFLQREGLRVREETVRRWIEGAYTPKVHVLPFVLKALGRALPDVDVRAEFATWLDLEREYAEP